MVNPIRRSYEVLCEGCIEVKATVVKWIREVRFPVKGKLKEFRIPNLPDREFPSTFRKKLDAWEIHAGSRAMTRAEIDERIKKAQQK